MQCLRDVCFYVFRWISAAESHLGLHSTEGATGGGVEVHPSGAPARCAGLRVGFPADGCERARLFESSRELEFSRLSTLEINLTFLTFDLCLF